MVRRIRRRWPVDVVELARDLVSGKAFEAVGQPGLVAFHAQHVVPAPTGDVLGPLALAVQRVRGEHDIGQVELLQHDGQGGDLVALGRHRELAGHGGGVVAQRGQQLRHHIIGCGSAAHQLAVHCDHPPTRDVSDPGRDPRSYPRVQVIGVEAGQRAPDRGFRREPQFGRDSQACQRIPSSVTGPLVDRDQRPGPRRDRSLGDRQDRGRPVPDPAAGPAGRGPSRRRRSATGGRVRPGPARVGRPRQRRQGWGKMTWRRGTLASRASASSVVTTDPMPARQQHPPPQSHTKQQVRPPVSRLCRAPASGTTTC